MQRLRAVEASKILHCIEFLGQTKTRSALVNSVWNIVKLQAQGKLFDQFLRVLIAAILSTKEKPQWSGEGYQALLIAFDNVTFSAIGACKKKFDELCFSSPNDKRKVKLALSSLAECMVDIESICVCERLPAKNKELKFIN